MKKFGKDEKMFSMYFRYLMSINRMSERKLADKMSEWGWTKSRVNSYKNKKQEFHLQPAEKRALMKCFKIH